MNNIKEWVKPKFSQKFEFFTLVTRFEEYKEMVNSAKKSGFDRNDVSFTYFDNKNKNEFDGFSGLNEALRSSNAEYIIYCHQDILFNYDDYNKLINCIEKLNTIDPLWAVAGNAGKTENGHLKIKITDPNGLEQTKGPFPSKVISLDENFLIINNRYNVSSSYSMWGFHLYGIDLCTNAINLGLTCYVIDFHLLHKSAGSIDNAFYMSRKNMISILESRKKQSFYSTTCTYFYAGNNKYFNYFMNNKLIIKLVFCFLKHNR